MEGIDALAVYFPSVRNKPAAESSRNVHELVDDNLLPFNVSEFVKLFGNDFNYIVRADVESAKPDSPQPVNSSLNSSSFASLRSEKMYPALINML